jgi:type I restriction enzyme R subunit
VSGVGREAAFESSIEAHLLSHRWGRLDPASYDVARGLFADELVGFVEVSQPDEWSQLVARHGGDAQARVKVGKRVADELTNRGTVDVLRRGVKDSGVAFRVAAFAPANGLTPDLVALYEANRLGVVRQLHHSESNPGSSLDLVLTLNGIPVATVELKNPLTHQTVEHAMVQYRSDRTPADLIFKHRAVVHFAVDPHQVYMTTRLARQDTQFLPFNQGSAGAGNPGGAGNPENPGGYQAAYLWERVWARDAWLAILGSFVHSAEVFDDAGNKTGVQRILFPRFHQWDAVSKLLAATRSAGPGVDRLVMHSAGSGKSNTIAWLAHQLSRLHTPSFHGDLTEEVKAAGLGVDQPIFHKVVVITDRVVLDRQLQSTVAGFDHTPGTIVSVTENSAQLRAALEGNAARVIVTTLQKFPVVAQAATELAGSRFAVIIDEAHSSSSGEAMKDLKVVLGGQGEALEEFEAVEAEAEDAVQDAGDVVAASMVARGKQSNLSFFAFTATPKPKTLELFGEKVTGADGVELRVPFHTYSMRQAIDERFIMDVLANYTTYATYYKLANTGPEDPNVPVRKASAALARFVSLHPTNLDQKAEVIVEHFRQKVAHKMQGRAKAMVVTRSRLHAVRYQRAIQRYIEAKGYDKGAAPLKALVAFSGSLTDPDMPGVVFTEAMMNGFGEAQLPKRFAGDDYQVLVVAEKYQTGFDQPLLHTMYVDKPLAGVKAVQTLSRLNRVHPDKQDTFVLDFANAAEDIQEAFRPFFESAAATATDPNMLYALQQRIHAALVIDPVEQAAAVKALLSGETKQQKAVYSNLDPAVARYTALDEDAQADFSDALVSYVRAYSFLAQVMPWSERDLEELYVYGKLLAELLPRRPGEPLPQISDAVRLTHLRHEMTGDQLDLALNPDAEQEPGKAFHGQGQGKQVEQPQDLLSVVIQRLNDAFGLDLTDADRIWFEQQKQVILDDPDMRVVALNNDREQFGIVLEKVADDMIVDRHQANAVLFDAYFDKPGVREALLAYLASVYDDIRKQDAAE